MPCARHAAQLRARAGVRAQVQRMEGWYKQRDNRLYPAWAYLAPTIILRLPYSLLAALLWCCIVYYPVGLAPEPSRRAAFAPVWLRVLQNPWPCDVHVCEQHSCMVLPC